MTQESGSINVGLITPDYQPPDTLSRYLNRKLQNYLDSVTHVAVVDKDIILPRGFYELAEKYPSADIISVNIVPSSLPFIVWEWMTLWTVLKPRVRDCAVIYKTQFLCEQGGFPDSETPGTILQERAGIIAIADLRAVHQQPFSLKHSVTIQIRDGRSRAKMGYSFWKTVLHSIFRIRPLVFLSYFYTRATMSNEKSVRETYRKEFGHPW